MRQAHLTAPRSIAFVESPTPEPGPGEVLVRIRAALTCGTDLKTYRRGHPKLGFGPFGHEASGDVIAVGLGVERFAPGDAVMWVQTAPCGACARCLADAENLCERLFDRIALGAYGDALLLPEHVVRQNLYHKPPQVSYVEAAFLEPLACVVHGWNLMRRASGGTTPASATIIGAGTIGLLHVLYARHTGAQTIIIARGEERARLATELGAGSATDAADQSAVGALAARSAAVIECAGSPDTWRQAVDLARPKGIVLFFGGLPGGTLIGLDATRIHYDELTCLGAFHFTPRDARDAYDVLASGISVRPLVSGIASLDDLPAIFGRLDRRDGYKYALIPGAREPAWI